MALNEPSLVYGVHDFPSECSHSPSCNPAIKSHIAPISHDHHHDEDNEPFEDLDDLNEITGDTLKNETGYGSENSRYGFRFKRKASVIRDFSSDSCNSDNYLDDPDWLGMIAFEEGISIADAQNPVDFPFTNPGGVGSGLDPDKPGSNPSSTIRETQGSGRQSEGIVSALMAPQFCPWRNKKGRVKMGRGGVIESK